MYQEYQEAKLLTNSYYLSGPPFVPQFPLRQCRAMSEPAGQVLQFPERQKEIGRQSRHHLTKTPDSKGGSQCNH
jgi:hypothetical protein